MKTRKEMLQALARRTEKARIELILISQKLEVLAETDEACLQLCTASNWVNAARTEIERVEKNSLRDAS
jgi:hypothetical protein